VLIENGKETPLHFDNTAPAHVSDYPADMNDRETRGIRDMLQPQWKREPKVVNQISLAQALQQPQNKPGDARLGGSVPKIGRQFLNFFLPSHPHSGKFIKYFSIAPQRRPQVCFVDHAVVNVGDRLN